MFVAEKSVERMGYNVRVTAFCHSKKNKITLAEAKTETNLHSQGASKIPRFALLSY